MEAFSNFIIIRGPAGSKFGTGQMVILERRNSSMARFSGNATSRQEEKSRKFVPIAFSRELGIGCTLHPEL